MFLWGIKNKMKKQSQLNIIKQQLLDKGWISRNDCLRNFITSRLGAYICDLQKEGWDIKGEYTKDKDFKYTLVKSPFKKQTWSVNGKPIGNFIVK